MPEMDRVVKLLCTEGIRGRVKVIVGGAQLNAKFAAQIGADGYGEDASSAVDLCRQLMGGRKGRTVAWTVASEQA